MKASELISHLAAMMAEYCNDPEIRVRVGFLSHDAVLLGLDRDDPVSTRDAGLDHPVLILMADDE